MSAAKSMSANSTVTQQVDQVIEAFFEQSIADAAAIHPHYEELWSDLYRLIQSGGKRLRPKMTILAYQAFGGNDYEAIVSVAAAQELLHCSLLIHDDIIDRDYVRYGVENIAGSYKNKYRPFVADTSENTHYAHSTALLGGDLLLSSAYKLINASSCNTEQKITASTLLSRSIFEVAGGELLDTEAAFREQGAGSALIIARYKTASYSFKGPLVTGAALAGADKPALTALETFADNLGIAYQLTDDLLGVFGDEAVTGKSSTGDIREGKKTFLVEQFVTLADAQAMAIFNENFGRQDITNERIAEIKELFKSTGALAATEAAIAQYEQKAVAALDDLLIAESDRAKLRELISVSIKRVR